MNDALKETPVEAALEEETAEEETAEGVEEATTDSTLVATEAENCYSNDLIIQFERY